MGCFWFLIKVCFGVLALVIVITWMVTYFDNRSTCKDLGGMYNLTTDGFVCQKGLKK